MRKKFPDHKIAKITVFLVIIMAFLMLALPAFQGNAVKEINYGTRITGEKSYSSSYNYSVSVFKYQWVNYTNTPAPASVSNASLSCFTPSKTVILFGGEYSANVSNKTVMEYSNQTWEYTYGSWSKLSTTLSPQPMAGQSMAYSARDNEIILFGGFNSTSYFNKTWVFTGYSWSPIKGLKIHPPSLAFAASTYSSMLQGVVLFGGKNGSAYFNSTWMFKDGSWALLNTTGMIPKMAGASLSQLPDGNLLLYGGYNGTYMSNTYLLNVKTLHWSVIQTSNSPGPLAFASLNYFSENNFTLLSGGQNKNGPVNSSWVFSYSTKNWLPISNNAYPALYGMASTAYEANSTIISFGGTFGGVNGYHNYTYEFLNNTYNWILFYESGLPSNLKWGIDLNGMYNNTTSSFVGFLVETGTYNYTVISPAGYTTSATNANITMYFSEETSTITFSKIPGTIYYFYGIFVGIGIVVVAYLISLAFRKK
ncbi:Kelch repeat-containing protein [Caldiplasma sukawensis]